MSTLRRALPLLALLAAADAHAFFEDTGAGARAQGLGTLGSAVIEDASAYHWNPSFLGRLERREGLVAYGKPLGVQDLQASALAVAGPGPGPLGGIGMALAWHRYSIAGVYAEDLFSISAGRTVRRFRAGHELAVGGSAKLGRVGIDPSTDPDTGEPVDFGSRSAFGLDTAVSWRTPWRLDVAWVAYDWTSPEFDFVEGGGGTDVRTRHRLAAAWRWNRESTVGAAWTSPAARGSSRVDVGVEIWFYEVFAIRSALTDIGGLPDPGTSAERFQYSGGVGLRNAKWRLDAAVATTRELGTSYRMSLSVPFGASRAGAAR